VKREQHRADRIIIDYNAALPLILQAIADYGDWHDKLALWAEAGYPSGSSGPTGVGGHSDPTARFALIEDRMAHELKRTRDDLDTLAAAVRVVLTSADSLARRRAWVVNPAKPPEKSYLIFCDNPRCQERIREEANERSRDGLCPRCYRHRDRYGRDYPMKEVVRRGVS
jgi:hypothetical protein